MSARTKIAKSLQVGAYAPVVFQPSATGEHIKRAVTELGLTGVTICGETVTADEPPGTPWTGLQGRQDVPPCAPQPQPKLPDTFINVAWSNDRWWIDFVSPTGRQTMAHRDTFKAAMSLAKRRARRWNLTVHQGSYVWEAAKPTPTRNFGFTESQLEWGDRECDARRGT